MLQALDPPILAFSRASSSWPSSKTMFCKSSLWTGNFPAEWEICFNGKTKMLQVAPIAVIYLVHLAQVLELNLHVVLAHCWNSFMWIITRDLLRISFSQRSSRVFHMYSWKAPVSKCWLSHQLWLGRKLLVVSDQARIYFKWQINWFSPYWRIAAIPVHAEVQTL